MWVELVTITLVTNVWFSHLISESSLVSLSPKDVDVESIRMQKFLFVARTAQRTVLQHWKYRFAPLQCRGSSDYLLYRLLCDLTHGVMSLMLTFLWQTTFWTDHKGSLWNILHSIQQIASTSPKNKILFYIGCEIQSKKLPLPNFSETITFGYCIVKVPKNHGKFKEC